MTPWPHQPKCVESVREAIAGGLCRILLQLGTGGGKTLIDKMLADIYLAEGRRGVLYVNRKELVRQTAKKFRDYGLDVGVRASGYENEYYKPFQISSVQTEIARKDRENWAPHTGGIAIISEAHLNAANEMQDLASQHIEAGDVIVGETATPIGLGHFYDHLIVGATNEELRECGATVPYVQFPCAEPDLSRLKVRDGEDPSAKEIAKLLRKTTQIIGHVIGEYRRLNPKQKPCLLFAPGVPESLWFAEQFYHAGIPAAHLDGENCWVNGVHYKSSPQMRHEIIGDDREPGMIRTGEIKVLCNRYVAREGVDIPEIEHIILATVMGSLQTLIQSVGRGGRACLWTGKQFCIVQDHGGHFWRAGLGCLNREREWNLQWTDAMHCQMHADRLRDGSEKPAAVCPVCTAAVYTSVCAACGHELYGRPFTRKVIQLDGTLQEVNDGMYKPLPIYNGTDGKKQWERMILYRSKVKNRDGTVRGRSFRECANLFAQENYGMYPDWNWPMMPRRELDRYREVQLVSRSELT